MLSATAEATIQYQTFDLESFVKNATWRELLIDLVEKNRLDPWSIDIATIAEKYIETVRRMRFLDLSLPANIILAASILLRLKSNAIILFPEEDVAEEYVQEQRITPEVPELVSRARLQPNRRVTLNELLVALDEAMRIVEKREYKARFDSQPVQLQIKDEDIDKKIEQVYSLISREADGHQMATFSALSKGFKGMESILLDLFIPLLFLEHKSRVLLIQESFFGEILVKCLT